MASNLRFLGQPSPDSPPLGQALQAMLGDAEIDRLTVVVAWARFRGVVRLQDDLVAFRERGGQTRAIVGIDEGGATRPGLLLVEQLFDESFVFHDRAGGTFHPKIYLGEGDDRAVLIVGSSNATPGGWFANYEASLEARFDLPAEENHPALSGARQFIDALLAEDELCRPLSQELAERLVRERRYQVTGAERNVRRRDDARTEAGDDLDASGSHDDGSEDEPLFGSRRAPRISVPPLSAEAKEDLAELEIRPDDEAESDEEIPEPQTGTSQEAPEPAVSGSGGVSVAGGAGADTGAAVVPGAAAGDASVAAQPVRAERKWSKVLPAGDAQHPPSGNPTGNLRLTKAGHDIDWLTWFRTDLFRPAAWRTATDVNGNAIERATIPFDVTINGLALGTKELEVTHAPHRESGQSNHTTVLRWGPLLGVLQEQDYTRFTVSLERMSNGSYRLDIS